MAKVLVQGLLLYKDAKARHGVARRKQFDDLKIRRFENY